jgi:hypothetical protein
VTNDERMKKLNVLIVTAEQLGEDEAGETIALLLGALTIACSRTPNPIDMLDICRDSLGRATDIAVAHVGTKGLVS